MTAASLCTLNKDD